MFAMPTPVFREIHPRSFLSFGPTAEPVELRGLNVLIGPNASGKSNLIEAFEILHATPSDLADAVRLGGGAGEWIWRGASSQGPVQIGAVLAGATGIPELRYRLEFAEVAQRLELIDEAIEETRPRHPGQSDVYFYYRFQRGRPAINTRQPGAADEMIRRSLRREDLDPQQSVLSQRRDPDLYPEVTSVAQIFGRIAIYREWSFGRRVALRQPQPADLPSDLLLPDVRNLGMVLNAIEHSDRWSDLNRHLQRFLPRFRRLSTRIEAGHVQVFLHEEGLRAPVPATRLSDGTIRFIALLAILLRPEAASLICLEEPELGLHPDAIGQLAELLVETSQRTQIILTTHSDGLVSALSDQPESVLVAEHFHDGTTLQRLEADKLGFWLEKYRLGEVWRLGQLGGNP
jgi:predicted ATPase